MDVKYFFAAKRKRKRRTDATPRVIFPAPKGGGGGSPKEKERRSFSPGKRESKKVYGSEMSRDRKQHKSREEDYSHHLQSVSHAGGEALRVHSHEHLAKVGGRVKILVPEKQTVAICHLSN